MRRLGATLQVAEEMGEGLGRSEVLQCGSVYGVSNRVCRDRFGLHCGNGIFGRKRCS